MYKRQPYASLDPRMTVGDIIGEGLENFSLHPNDRQERIHELLSLVGLNKEHAGRFPHEFSGGQRQRIGIARALAVDPEFIAVSYTHLRSATFSRLCGMDSWGSSIRAPD